MTFHILWPDRRDVADAQVVTWARDAIANGELASDACDLDNANDCAVALTEAGLITLRNPTKRELEEGKKKHA